MQVERSMRAEGFGWEFEILSGGRVSNAWVTYLSEGNNNEKSVLIPHKVQSSHDGRRKGGGLERGYR